MGRATQDVTLWDESSDYAAGVTTNNRLRTETTISFIPATAVQYKLVKLLNGTSSAQNVDGSVTPVVFEWKPGMGETWYVESVIFIFSDTGVADIDDYGVITNGLTNGCLLKFRSNGVEGDGQTLKNNISLTQLFSQDSFSPYGNFMGNKSTFLGRVNFNHPFVLKDSTSDYVRMTIRDNLIGIDFQEMSVLVWREAI